MQLQKLGILTFWVFPWDHQQKEARLSLHWRVHISVKGEFDYELFQFLTYHSYRKLGLFTEDEFLSESSIGFLSSSKLKFIDQDQKFWLGKSLGKSNPNLTPDQKTLKRLKLIILVHSLYLEIGEGSGVDMFTRQR